MIDEKDNFFFAIFVEDYPPRVAFKMIQELKTVFTSNFKNNISSAKENELSKNAKKIFISLVNKYKDVSGVDAIIKSQMKAESVKDTLSETISVLLENQESADRVMKLAENVNQEAAIFKKNSKKLKDRLRCAVYKVTLCMQTV